VERVGVVIGGAGLAGGEMGAAGALMAVSASPVAGGAWAVISTTRAKAAR